jgi:hypothetical protein
MTDLLDYEVRLALPCEEKNDVIYITGQDGKVTASKNNMWLDTTVCESCSLDLRTTDSPYNSVCPRCGSDLPWRVMVTASC